MATATIKSVSAAKVKRAANKQSESSGRVAEDASSVNFEDDQNFGEVTGQREVVGKRLIALIQQTVKERGLPDRTAADIIGATGIYWNSLCNGNRKITSLPKEKFLRIAEFVERPLIEVYSLADFFGPEDFFRPTDMDRVLMLSIRKMRQDPTWGSFAPSDKEWEQIPTRVKVALVSLYERASGNAMLKTAAIEDPSLLTGPLKA